MMGISCNPMSSVERSSRGARLPPPPFSRAIWRWNRCRCISSMPKACIIRRSTSYGGVSPCSNSSSRGFTSASTKRRTMSRITWCCSLHSNIGSSPVARLEIGDDLVRLVHLGARVRIDQVGHLHLAAARDQVRALRAALRQVADDVREVELAERLADLPAVRRPFHVVEDERLDPVWGAGDAGPAA